MSLVFYLIIIDFYTFFVPNTIQNKNMRFILQTMISTLLFL